eukprot:scaffold492_cov257-Pinguiococcus_pyrenoidosus.AAC.44
MIVEAETKRELQVALFSHSLDLDGGPRLLYNVGIILAEQGAKVTVFSPFEGSLRQLYEEANIRVKLLKVKGGNFWVVGRKNNVGLDGILHTHFSQADMPDLVILNTIMWANYVIERPLVRAPTPRVAWMLHESEIVERNKAPNGYWFGLDFPHLQQMDTLRQLTTGVDSIIFVADAVRALWSHADFGNFHTFRGFIDRKQTEERAMIVHNEAAKQELRYTVTGGEPEKFILTTTGTICTRKQQGLLVRALEQVGDEIFGKDGFVLLLIGAPSEAGGKGEMRYVEELERYIHQNGLQHMVQLIPFASDTLKYVAIADLHFSVSINEALPLNTMEAMLFGVPVMMTRAGGSEEELHKPGYDGDDFGDGFLLSLTSDSSTLAAEMKALLKPRADRPFDLRKELPEIGKRGYATADARFTKEGAISRVTDMVSQTMGLPFANATSGEVCIVVRTYQGQMTDPVYSLETFLRSVLHFNYKAWTALIVQTDSKEMVGLYGLLSKLNDPRLKVVQYPDLGSYKTGAFVITDRVIPQCPQNAEWLLVTNGDNIYDPRFLDHLDLDYDVIAYDFYSRSTHILDPEIAGLGCRKYFEYYDSLCKKNTLKHWHTDLGANIMNLKRWRLEQRSFEALNEEDGSADGKVMESVTYYGWSVKRVGGRDRCLFSHNPNVDSCARAGPTTIWVDDIQECILDETEKKRYIRGGHHPYFSPNVNDATKHIQGRCYDNACPKHHEFVSLRHVSPAKRLENERSPPFSNSRNLMDCLGLRRTEGRFTSSTPPSGSFSALIRLKTPAWAGRRLEQREKSTRCASSGNAEGSFSLLAADFTFYADRQELREIRDQ